MEHSHSIALYSAKTESDSPTVVSGRKVDIFPQGTPHRGGVGVTTTSEEHSLQHFLLHLSKCWSPELTNQIKDCQPQSSEFGEKGPRCCKNTLDNNKAVLNLVTSLPWSGLAVLPPISTSVLSIGKRTRKANSHCAGDKTCTHN